jgi:hypothetical protein
MSTSKWLYLLAMINTRSTMIKLYGKEFWIRFQQLSKQRLTEILNELSPIGDSAFALNYYLGPCYIAWYHSAVDLGLSQPKIDQLLWLFNEKLVGIFPSIISTKLGKAYLNQLRSSAIKHINYQTVEPVHPFDWEIVYREVSQEQFEIDIHQCGLYKLGTKYQATGMFPALCRLDYLFASKLAIGFERTMTIGDGDTYCNCRYCYNKKTLWNPSAGFKGYK